MKKLLSTFFVSAFALTAAQAQIVLIDWETGGIAGGVPSPTTLASNSNAANMQAANLNAGGGLTAFGPSNDAGRFQFTNWNTDGALATAMSGGDYIEFTLNAEAGYEFTLANMDVYWRNRAGTTGAYNLVLASSHNSYATAIATMSMPAGNTQQSFTTVDISSIPGSLTTVTLRLAVLGVDNTGRPIALTGNGSGSELIIRGTVNAIPEPTSALLLAAGLTTLVIFRRRRAIA